MNRLHSGTELQDAQEYLKVRRLADLTEGNGQGEGRMVEGTQPCVVWLCLGLVNKRSKTI